MTRECRVPLIAWMAVFPYLCRYLTIQDGKWLNKAAAELPARKACLSCGYLRTGGKYEQSPVKTEEEGIYDNVFTETAEKKSSS